MAGHLRRLTHEYDGELVVFLVGMKIRKPWRPDHWLPVLLAMPGMLAELARNPDSGVLGSRLVLEGGGPFVLQYWSSAEKLYAYAGDPTATHRPAWTAFNRRARKAAESVGVWHETYAVASAETTYVNMPADGLAKVTRAVRAGSRHGRVAGRRTVRPEVVEDAA